MDTITLSFMQKSDIQESANILSVAMLDAKLHVAVLLGKGERERQEINKMFVGLFTRLPGIVFLAKEKEQIVGVMWIKMYGFMKNSVLTLFRNLTYLVLGTVTCCGLHSFSGESNK